MLLSLDGSCTSELKRTEENNRPVFLWNGEILQQAGRGFLAVDAADGRAKVGPALGAPSRVHFTYTLSCELNLGPGWKVVNTLMLIPFICILTFRATSCISLSLFLSIADSGAPVCEMGMLRVRWCL